MKRVVYIIAALMILFQASCDKTEVWPRVNREDVPEMDYLTVLSTMPTHGQNGVPVSATISIEFSDNVNDASLIDGATLLLNGSSAGGYNYDEVSRTLEISPGVLSHGTVHTVQLTTGIETLVGETLKSNYQFQFTTAPAGAPVIEVSHSSVNIPHTGAYEFGLIDEASSLNKSFTIDNTGDSSLNISSITLGGSDPGDYFIAPFTESIPPGDSDTFSVEFDPTSTGDKSALVSINSDAVVDPFQFTVTGSSVDAGTYEPDIALFQGTTEIHYNSQYNFATYGLGELSPPIPFTIKNMGNDDLIVSTIQLTDDSGGRFSIETNPASVTPVTINPGADATFTMRFSSPNGVVFFGTVEITSNDPDAGSFVFRVKGKAK